MFAPKVNLPVQGKKSRQFWNYFITFFKYTLKLESQRIKKNSKNQIFWLG